MDELTLNQFLERVAQGAPTPGGGSAAALAGSLGASLVEMVVNLTIGKKEFAGSEEQIKTIGQEARSYREALARTIQEDISAYQSVMAARRLPRGSEEEKKRRKEEIQKALRKAADPPLFTAVTSLKVLRLCEIAVAQGNPKTVTDGAVGALLAHAALRGGILNVLANLSALDDVHDLKNMGRELGRLKAEGDKIKESTLALVEERMLSE